MNKIVVVYEERSCLGYFRGVPENVRDFTQWLSVQIASVPAEHARSTAVEFKFPEKYSSTDDPEMSICISYVRPETASERQIREDTEAGVLRIQQAEERATLQRLLRKYPLDHFVKQ